MKKSRILFALLSIFLLTSSVKAHDWYDRECCSNEDCRPVENCDEIEILPNNKAKWQDKIFEKIKPSKDNKCHVCITHWGKPMCTYVHMGT